MSTPPATILAAFLGHAARDPERPCLIWQGAPISYGALAAAAARWRNYYVNLFVAPGDRVGLYLGSSPTFLAAYLGAHMARAAVVLMNTQYRQAELSHIIGDSAPTVVVSDAAGAVILDGQGAKGPTGPEETKGAEPIIVVADPSTLIPPGLTGVPPEQGIEAVAPPHPPPAAHPDAPRPTPDTQIPFPPSAAPLPTSQDLALLAYTSGTTGRAKGAMLTHGNLAANSAAVTAAWRWTERDRLLLTLPLFHIHGLGVGVHGTLLAGASMDLRPGFHAAEVLQALRGGSITMYFGVPTMYTRLIQEVRSQPSDVSSPGPATTAAPPTLPTSVRLFVSGSAPLSPQTFAEFAELFGQPILERYGMTETVMNLTNPYAGERRPGTVGAPFPGQEARVVDVRSREPLPDDTIGEIQVRGPHVCAGYWRNPAATAEVFHPDGWFSTGDLGKRSPDGYYTITGRAKELIISGGYNVYPREVEELLLGHPAVAECAVFGRPDPDLGERVVAAVVLSLPQTSDGSHQQADPPDSELPTADAPRPTVEALIGYCRERLARYKVPREIRIVAALPRNAMGKVQKHLLQ